MEQGNLNSLTNWLPLYYVYAYYTTTSLLHPFIRGLHEDGGKGGVSDYDPSPYK